MKFTSDADMAEHRARRSWYPAICLSGMIAGTVRRKSLVVTFELTKDLQPVLNFIQKYSDVPMSLADACLARMTETRANSVILTIDTDFRIYRRDSRQIVPCMTPH
jgi:hypothetical protein